MEEESESVLLEDALGAGDVTGAPELALDEEKLVGEEAGIYELNVCNLRIKIRFGKKKKRVNKMNE